MEKDKNNIKQSTELKDDILKKKGYTYFALSGLFFALFAIFSVLSGGITTAKPVIVSGLFISGYFIFQGINLIYINKTGKYVFQTYICSKIEKTGYRGQNRKIFFLETDTNEPFIYNTTKNTEFIEGVFYDVYFNKDRHKSTLNVLAIAVSKKQKVNK